ncbi:MAG: hypothetical protein IKN65_06180 [Clostridia bacterium]|nr:hypothetical protein [Clostridia bacterium]
MNLKHEVNNAILKTLPWMFNSSSFSESVMDYLYDLLHADCIEENIDTIEETIKQTEKDILAFIEQTL